MLETLPHQSSQLEYHTPDHQQKSFHCRSSGLFQYRAHTPVSPSPLGTRNANARSTLFSMMDERDSKSGGYSDQENLSSSPLNPINNSDNSSGSKLFSFSPANSNNIVTPPQKHSAYEERFRRSGGTSNPFTKIFGSSPSSSGGSSSSTTTTSTSSKHRQLFFNRVKQNRDDVRFNSRGESLVMMEYHSEQQSWDERMRRKADTLSHQYHLEEEEIPAEDEENIENVEMMRDPEQSALEHFLMQEQAQDLNRSLLETVPGNGQNQSPTKNVHSDRSSFCGDDGDYDDIFMELVDNDEYQTADTTMSF